MHRKLRSSHIAIASSCCQRRRDDRRWQRRAPPSSFLPPQPHNLKWVGGGRAGEEADAADGDGRAGERTGARIGQWHRYSDGILTPGPSVSTKLWILSQIRSMMMSRAVLLFSFKDCKTIQSIQNQHGVTSSSGRFVIKSAAWSVLIVAPRTQPLP